MHYSTTYQACTGDELATVLVLQPSMSTQERLYMMILCTPKSNVTFLCSGEKYAKEDISCIDDINGKLNSKYTQYQLWKSVP